MIGNIKKFSFGELTSNNSGKTSGSGTAGLIISVVGALCFVFGCIIKDTVIITSSVTVITIGATLLGYRKSKEDSTPPDNTTITKVDNPDLP